MSNGSARILIAFAFITLPACSDVSEDTSSAAADLWAAKTTRWPVTEAGTTISICWENSGHAREKDLVRQTIREGWSSVARVDFTGWETCIQPSGSAHADVRLRIADEQPRVASVNGVTHFGAALEGVAGGLTLNFTFVAWNSSCGTAEQRDRCIRYYALHEFGHVLGFLHEQDRLDAPLLCPNGSDKRTGTRAEIGITLGAYDPDSIMNYCATGWPKLNLSAGDVAGVRKWYGVR